MDRAQVTLLALFYVRVAFDKGQDHDFLIRCLLIGFCISGEPLEWLWLKRLSSSLHSEN